MSQRVILLEWKLNPRHARVAIFTGPDREHLTNAGTLWLDPDEAETFRQTVRQGIHGTGYTGVFERGWDE